MTAQEALYNYCLRLGDDALIGSYRLSEWCSNGPLLEEDLALTNIALDMLGRAQAMLKYAGEVQGNGKTEDDLAYRRPENRYYNHLITELPNGNFADTVARQFFVGVYELYLYTQLQQATDSTLAAIAAKTLKEVKYHQVHFRDWLLRLGDGTPESHAKMQQAVNDLWGYTGELFEMDATEQLLLANNNAVDTKVLQEQWLVHVADTLRQATLEVPAVGYMHSGGRKGIHTEHLGHILAEMQYLQRAYPDAQW